MPESLILTLTVHTHVSQSHPPHIKKSPYMGQEVMCEAIKEEGEEKAHVHSGVPVYCWHLTDA